MSDVRRAAYLLNLILALTAVAAFGWRRPAPAVASGRPAAPAVPARIGEWVSQGEDPIPDNAREVLASAAVVNRTYARSPQAGLSSAAGAIPITFTMIGGEGRDTLHDPRSCFVGAGWRIENDHIETLPGTDLPIHACRLVQESAPSADGSPASPAFVYDALYFYLVDGRSVSDVTSIRAKMLIGALTGQKGRPVYFLRFVRPVPPELADGQTDTVQYLRAFAAAMWKSVGADLRKRQSDGSALGSAAAARVSSD